ncbi:MAG: sugar phosphate isomerase/epimerase [Planctomycetes bacterium]|nr:sugar phosphate isomerase/epimerase [Planctomycetota bacterium]
MFPCVSQVCSLAASLEDDFDGCADAAGGAIELWLTKVEEYLTDHTPADVKARAEERGLKLAAASFQGGLLVSQGESRRLAWEQFQRRLELCQSLQVPVLVVVADFLGPFSQTDIERAQVSLRQAGEAAARHGVKLALEFQARNTFVNNLETAVMLVQSVGLANVGICLDLFHFFVGPSKFEDLAHLTADNLFHVQVADVADRPRELAGDSDRILPGDGDFRLRLVFDALRDIGYRGAISLELTNPQFWQIAPRQVAEIGLTALRLALGDASGR